MNVRQRAFTLVELLITIVIVAVVLVLAVPSFQKFIITERMKSINAQLATDLQAARAEAVSRATVGRVMFGSNSSMTCYTIYIVRVGASQQPCDCTRGPGNACIDANNPNVGNATTEIRTVQVPSSAGVAIVVGPDATPLIGFDPLTGALNSLPTDSSPLQLDSFQVDTAMDSSHLMRIVLGPAGRAQLCSLGDSYGPPPC
jgi:type IV fimbrial biogenesis protein FimT